MGDASTSWFNSMKVSVIALGAVLAVSAAEAQTKKSSGVTPPPEASQPSTSAGKADKVDISDIENKYWAPKDADFSVVQNRTYTKANRLSVTAQYGPIVNETFSNGNSTALGVNYFFSERFGVQADYVMSDYRDSDVVNAFQAQGGSPDYGRVTGYYGVGFNIVPFYAKMSVWGTKIIYFDMAVTPTLGMTSYEQLTLDAGSKDKSALTYGVDITQWFFLHKNFAIRVDIKNRWFKEEIVKFQTDGSVVSGTKLRNKNTDNTLFLLGATVFF